ncbi:glycosyltransferase [Kibdelosporangium aridum]|uniref:Glycosyltransferase n=1 Tax=Kibdelosporangium aridum TaxID=2030 RepID=A0A428ZIQ4_KIBAR|nr:glycosyltransferase [Kibdelosporangium aridum]RSM87962.1 glycosyltransferase [Kibdelosporangium aridum]
MRVLLITHGSRGDVQPFVALSLALTTAGHDVVLACPAGSTSLANIYCETVIPLDDGTNKLVNDRKAWKAVESNFRGVRGKVLGLQLMWHNRTAMAPVFEDLAVLTSQVAGQVDLVVHQVNVPGHAIAEKLGVPAVVVCLQPFWVPTRSFPDPLFPFPVPAVLNRASYLTTKTFVRALTGNFGEWRHERLALPDRRHGSDVLRNPDGSPAVVLQAFSEHLLPEGVRYPDSVHTPGFFYLHAQPDWSPSLELSQFLADGPPPVYVGFGSMVGSDPAKTARIVAEAIRKAEVRAVVAVGRGGIRPEVVGKDMFCLDQAPHDWLFPRMAAVVHHGGAGTVGAALASGRPQVVCPFMFDQPYFGRRLHVCGVAPPALPLRTLTSDALASAIRQAACDASYAMRAEELGHLVRTENGAHQAVKILETIA